MSLPTSLSRESNTSTNIALTLCGLFYCILVALSGIVFPIWVPVLLVSIAFLPLFTGTLFNFRAPKDTVRLLFSTFLILNILWPRYIAIQIPGPDLNPQRIALLITSFIFIFSFISQNTRQWAGSLIKEQRLWIFCVLLLFSIRAIASLTGMAPAKSAGPMANEFFEFIVLFLIAYIFFENFKQIEKLTMVLLVIAVAAALMAIIEYYLKKNLFSNISLPGIALDPAYLIQALSDKSRGGTYRSQAAFSHPLLLAEFCVFAIPIAFYFLRTESALNRIFGAIGIIAIPAAGITSGSRSALVAIGFVLLLSYALTAWRISLSKKFGHFGWFLYLLGFSILGLLVYFAIDSGLIDNLLFGQSLRERQSTLARIQMFETGIPAIQSAPFLGFGVGNAAEVTGFSSNGSLSIDSFFLSFILESGIPSIIFFLLLAFLPLTMATFSKQAIENVNERDLMASILIGVIGMLAVKSILSLNGNTYLIFIAAAFALRLQIKSQLNK